MSVNGHFHIIALVYYAFDLNVFKDMYKSVHHAQSTFSRKLYYSKYLFLLIKCMHYIYIVTLFRWARSFQNLDLQKMTESTIKYFKV